MKKIEDHCFDCAVPGYPCLGASCPNRAVEVYYCDKCGEAIDEENGYEVDGEDICKDCLKEKFRED